MNETGSVSSHTTSELFLAGLGLQVRGVRTPIKAVLGSGMVKNFYLLAGPLNLNIPSVVFIALGPVDYHWDASKRGEWVQLSCNVSHENGGYGYGGIALFKSSTILQISL